MANSRSNIYPVQLQGAELNLNKYDAEIKQYSGFNKNNSPFVGGCLSNLFTKDETMEGATSKNTYIAPDGDVYRVTTEGLFKNDEKLIDTSDADFFDVVDLGADIFPASTVYIYDEETYIYIKDGKYYYHSGKVDHDFLSPYGDTVNINKYVQIEFRIKKVVVSGVEYEVVGILFNKIFNSQFDIFAYLSIYEKTEEGTLADVYTIKFGNDYFYQLTIGDQRFANQSFVVRTQGTTYDDFRIVIINCATTSSSTHKNNFELSFNGSAISFVSYLDIAAADGSLSYVNQLINFRFSDKEAVVCNSGQNVAPYLGYNTVKSSYTIDLTNKKILIDNATQHIAHTLIQASGRYDIVRPWGILSALKEANNGRCYTIDDDVTAFAYVDENADTFEYKVQSNLGSILNGCVLINNRLASGLSLPGGMQLVSEWNTVDLDYIFFGDNTEDWRDNKYVYIWKNINTGKWHKLIKSTPWLKLINNQVIINANTILNSVEIKDNKKLLFAPAWNNRRPYIDFNNTSSDVYYVATAINEYELKNNASIIINPVLVNGRMSININSVENTANDINNYILANIYLNNNNGTNVDYRYSQDLVSKNFIIIESKSGLPFPSNTDGNVQYSPSLFAIQKGQYGNLVFISEGGTAYKLMTYDNKAVMSYFLSTAIEGLQDFFTIQGQLYGILDNQIYNFSIVNEIANRGDFVVSVEGLQFVGNTPYEALFFSKTNRCLYSFTGANILNAKQFVDKISEVRNYKYNPATQSIFLITDIGVIVYSLFGIYQIDFPQCKDMYLLNNGVILTDNEGTFKYVKYYKEETTDDYTKENIQLETCFYGMNNQTVTINDCLYFRIFSEEHEEGDLEVSATTISLQGRMTEKTIFRIKESDWDKETNTIYLRYQPKEQRGLGISFKINSPFKIASLSVGSQADAILVDKVSKGAINAPQRTSNNAEW